MTLSRRNPWHHRAVGLVKRSLKIVIQYNSNILFEENLENTPIPSITPRIAVDFRIAGIQDLPSFLDVTGYPADQDRLARDKSRLERGDICFIGLHSGKIVNYSWATFSEAELPGNVSIPLGSGRAYLYRAYTVP